MSKCCWTDTVATTTNLPFGDQYMPLLFFFSIVRMSLKFPVARGIFSGQKKETAVLGATFEPATASPAVINTKRSPFGSQAKFMTGSLMLSTTSTGTPFSLTLKISRFVARVFFDFEWRSTLTQIYAPCDCQCSLASETLNRFLVLTISLLGIDIKPTFAGLEPISGVQ
jgi:hypothetical protein